MFKSTMGTSGHFKNSADQFFCKRKMQGEGDENKLKRKFYMRRPLQLPN
jgi:hypothetical protein